MSENLVDNHCLRTALRLLGRRDHSAAELSRKLQSRGFGRDAIEPVIFECLRLNYVDDRKFTANYVRSLKEKGFGPLRMAQMLRSKGLDEELIAAAQESLMAFDEQFTHCRRVMKKKRRAMKAHKDPFKLKTALYRFLTGRGFSAEVVSQTLREAFDRPDVEEDR